MPAVVRDSRSSVKTDPLRNFRFQVNINYQTSKGNMAARLGFMTVGGLSVETDLIAYRQGGFNTTALPLDAPVLTTTGWKDMGDIEVGDRVIDPRGEDSKVVQVLPSTVKDVYRITMSDGSQAEACFGHLWEVQVRDTNNRKRVEVMSTLDVKSQVERKGYQVLLPKMEPFTYDLAPELPLDPYLLGVLLAEGTFADSVTLASVDAEVIDWVRATLPDGHRLEQRKDGTCKHAVTVGNTGGAQSSRNTHGRNLVLAALRGLGLSGHRSWEKFIPEAYLRASVTERLSLLRGIMDGDGSCTSNGSTRFTSTSKALTEGVRELVVSLGGRARITTETERTYKRDGVVVPCRDTWSIHGFGGLEMNPFALPRKAVRYRSSSKSSSEMRRIISVELVGPMEVQCIEVSAESHLFISHDFVPSHNTQKMPGQSNFPPLTLSRGMMVGFGDQYEWYKSIFSVVSGRGPAVGGAPTDFRADLDIYVLAHPWTRSTSVPVKAKYHVYNAWPQSLAYSDLDAGGNGLIMEQMVLQHEGFGLVYAADNGNSDVQASQAY